MKEKSRNRQKNSSYPEIRVKRVWVNEFQLYKGFFFISKVRKWAEFNCIKLALWCVGLGRHKHSTHETCGWQVDHSKIFTMVSYFLHWTLLKFFNSIPDNHCQHKVHQWAESHAQWLIHQMKLGACYCGNFEFYKFSLIILERVFVRSIVNIRDEYLFHMICLSSALINSPWTGKKDIHSLTDSVNKGKHMHLHLSCICWFRASNTSSSSFFLASRSSCHWCNRFCHIFSTSSFTSRSRSRSFTFSSSTRCLRYSRYRLSSSLSSLCQNKIRSVNYSLADIRPHQCLRYSLYRLSSSRNSLCQNKIKTVLIIC